MVQSIEEIGKTFDQPLTKEIVEKTLDLLRSEGWVQMASKDGGGYCLNGALSQVVTGNPYAWDTLERTQMITDFAVRLGIVDYTFFDEEWWRPQNVIVEWNDQEETEFADVERRLLAAIASFDVEGDGSDEA